VEEAKRTLSLKHRDPTIALSAGDLREANAKREFVKEDCETMPLADVTDRARAALAAGDKTGISSTRATPASVTGESANAPGSRGA